VYSPDGPSTNRVAVELLGWRWKDESRNWFGCPAGVMRPWLRAGIPGIEPFWGFVRDSLGLLREGENRPKYAFFPWNSWYSAENMWVNDHNMTLLWSFP